MWKRFTEVCLMSVLAGVLGSGCSTLPDEHIAARTPARVTTALEEEYRQAHSLMQAEQWREAGERLEVITVQYPDYAGPWLNLGICRSKLGEIEAAETAFKASIERNPDNPVAYNQLGILYRHLGRFDEAWAMYEAALAVAPDDPDTHWNLGILHDLYLPDTGQALQHYERYRQLTGSDDRQLQAWIADLMQRIEGARLTAGVQP